VLKELLKPNQPSGYLVADKSEAGRRPVQSQIPLHYPGRRQVRGWLQTC